MVTTTTDRLLLNIEANVKGALAALGNVEKALGGSLAIAQNLNNMFLGLGLTLLFTGMAIKNFFQGILNSMLQSFLLAEGESGIINNKIQNLRAAFEFLKVSIIDAFAETGMLDVWVGRIERFTNILTNMSTEQQSRLADIMAMMVVLGGVAMVMGQLFLGLMAPLTVVIWLIQTLGPIAKLIFTRGILIPLGLIGLVIGALIWRFQIWKKELGSWGLAFKALLWDIGGVLIDAIVWPLTMMITSINLLIAASNKLAGTNFKKIPTLGEFMIEGRIAEIRAQAAETREANQININVEGDVTDEGLIDKVLNILENRLLGTQGSTQQ